MVFFPSCLGAPAKIRFGERTAPVTSDLDSSACLDAAAASAESSLDIDVPDFAQAVGTASTAPNWRQPSS